MKAVGIVPGEERLEMIDKTEPFIDAPDQVMVRVLEVGLCDIDQDIVAGRTGSPPPTESSLVLGHEMLGQVVEVGAEVESVRRGDLVVATVRRGCEMCVACLNLETDFCLTNLYAERGIARADGYLSEYIVDREAYIVRVPRELRQLAVLLEPLSLAEKAVVHSVKVQQRVPWPCEHPEHAYISPEWGVDKVGLVFGAGATGLLLALLLAEARVRTWVLDLYPEHSLQAKLARDFGARYLDVNRIVLEDIGAETGNIDLVFETTGDPEFVTRLPWCLGAGGVYNMLFPPRETTGVDAAELMRVHALRNQVAISSLSANRRHYEQALLDLGRFRVKHVLALNKLITHRIPFDHFREAFRSLSDPNAIKTVIQVYPD